MGSNIDSVPATGAYIYYYWLIEVSTIKHTWSQHILRKPGEGYNIWRTFKPKCETLDGTSTSYDGA